MAKPKIGLALGSGSARGWAHIGVIKALEEMGIKPDLVCGSSIGSLVGAAYTSGNLDKLEDWVRKLSFWDVVKLLDIKLAGGLIEGSNLMASFRKQIEEIDIEELDIPFAAVATELSSGREVWLREGALLEAVRASIALPGLFSPYQRGEEWLIDGGLVNPVPVSLCRALGAQTIIAVNLNSDILGRHLERPKKEEHKVVPDSDRDLLGQWMDKLNDGLRQKALNGWRNSDKDQLGQLPGLLEVTASAINIMQDRITRSRMAGDPPDIILTPRMAHLGLLEFDRAADAIKEGEACVERMASAIEYAVKR